MGIKNIDSNLCQTCAVREASGCAAVDSCPTDVLRQDNNGYPLIPYADDCMNCFLCEKDCPMGAIEVSPIASFPILAY